MMRILIYLTFLGFLVSLSACKKTDEPFSEETTSKIVEYTYPKNDGPYKNPLKGWNTGWWKDYDYASVGFQYIKWKDFEPTNGNFNYDYIEEVINRPGSAGRHLILRLYADWYGENEVSDGGPSWLYDEISVERLRDENGKYITNFNNEKFISEAQEAIKALSIRYDSDPRIYAFQLGVIGYWGEWHSYGYSQDFYLTNETKNQILGIYKDNFKSKKLMGRYPWIEPLKSTGNIGFHNDYFGPVPHSDEFDDAIFESNKWIEGPIGGEYPPQISENEFNQIYLTGLGETMIKKGHYSTMKVINACEDQSNELCETFMKLHRLMGYNYQIEKCRFQERILTDELLSIELEITNIGVAPMYYDWDVEFGILSNEKQLLKVFETDYKTSSILPGDNIIFRVEKSLANLLKGKYNIGVRIVQPNSQNKKSDVWKLDSRNTYILFSNEVEVIDGYWDSQNALEGGWSILGEFDIE